MAFLIGGLKEGSDWGNLYWPVIYDVFFFGFQSIAFYVSLPRAARFYKWNEELYWNQDQLEDNEFINSM